MTQWYEAPCPACGGIVLFAPAEQMGFPQIEPGDENPLATNCDKSGTVLGMTWNATLHEKGKE
jgi:hypothetical protein